MSSGSGGPPEGTYWAFISYLLCPVAYNGELYIFGGYNARLDRHFNDLWKFNPGELGKNNMRAVPAMLTIHLFEFF